MTDGRFRGGGRYATGSVVYSALVAGPLPTWYILGLKGPDAFRDGLLAVSVPIVLLLLLIFSSRPEIGAPPRRSPAAASPLHRLQEWDGMDDPPAALEPPTSATYLAWRESLAGRVAEAWGRPLPPWGRSLLSGVFFITFAVWLALAVTLWTGNVAAERFWSSTGLPAWQLFAVVAAILAVLKVKQWAMNTAEAVRRLVGADRS